MIARIEPVSQLTKLSLNALNIAPSDLLQTFSVRPNAEHIACRAPLPSERSKMRYVYPFFPQRPIQQLQTTSIDADND